MGFPITVNSMLSSNQCLFEYLQLSKILTSNSKIVYDDQKIAKYMPHKHNIDLENKNFKIVSSQIKSNKYNLMQICHIKTQ